MKLDDFLPYHYYYYYNYYVVHVGFGGEPDIRTVYFK